jgi:CBS-domain-containing membrane protein
MATATITLPMPMERSLYFSEQVDQASIKALKEKIDLNPQDLPLQLKTLEEKTFSKPKFDFKFDIIATDNAGRQSKKANSQSQTEMEIRTNWVKTQKELNETK